MLRKLGKTKVFLHIEAVYVKEASKNKGLSSPRARLRKGSLRKRRTSFT